MQTRDEFIDAHQNDFIAELGKLVSIQTFRKRGNDLKMGIEFLQQWFKRLHAEIQLVQTSGAPTIIAKIRGKSEQTAVFYGHYDTMPAGDRSLWTNEPFQLTEQNGRLFGRGAGDNKGQLMAQILGVYTYLQIHQQLPFTAIFLVEGEEEQGSLNLPTTVAQLKNTELNAAKLAVVVDGSMSQSGQHVLRLGNRGILAFRLTLTTAKNDQHSGNLGNIMPNAVLALNKLIDRLYVAKEQQVLIPGFYDGVPTAEQIPIELIDQLPYDAGELKTQLGVDSLPDKQAYYRKLMFEPTFNITSYQSSGATADFKTIIPHQATAQFDCRLVGQQSVRKIKAGIQQLLAPEIQSGRLRLNFIGGVPASNAHFSSAALEQFKKILKTATGTGLIEPVMPGTVPNYVWTDILQVPTVTIPYANFDQHNHVPNENLTKQAYFDGIRVSYELMARLTSVLEKL